jgi:hypothetical protein
MPLKLSVSKDHRAHYLWHILNAARLGRFQVLAMDTEIQESQGVLTSTVEPTSYGHRLLCFTRGQYRTAVPVCSIQE